jgi:glycogen debranching enzyme
MILLRANRDLLALAEALGRRQDSAEIKAWIEKSRAGIDWLWNDETGAFCSRDLIDGRSSAMITSASFLSFYAGVGTEKQRQSLIAHLERIERKIHWMLPSLDPDHEAFDPMRYWRGPCWAVVTFLVARGLLDEGESAWAERLRHDTAALIRDTGFYEAFCPISGRGTGGDQFSWTAAMWLFWAGKA